MNYIADLHIHSRYSRATSKKLDLEALYQWAQIKGIHVVGTGDFTHPEWLEEMQEKLVPDGNGLFRLKNPPNFTGLPGIKTTEIDVRFCLSAEISSIYKHADKVRKNHNLLYAPDFDTVKRINARLREIGNLASDGRPILGLPSRDLLEIVLESSDHAHLIPAHVWTPWFSTLGSKAGYDSIDECFRDLSDNIFALETGLSSDPDMNWKISSLDKYTLVSNSDAHSPQKLGREANIFNTELSYYAMFDAIKTRKGFDGTFEFFPEEGKYHMDGHRKCNVCMEPRDSIKQNEICPVCGKPLTIGVLNRVEKLADRELPQQPKDAPGFKYIIPLPEIISEFTGTSPSAKSVQQQYTRVISAFGNEFNLLHTIPMDEIKAKGGELLTEAIRRLRNHEVNPKSGYDGEFGVISIFNPGELDKLLGQSNLFGDELIKPTQKRKTTKQTIQKKQAVKKKATKIKLNAEQLTAIQSETNTIVTAGPGTGKTNTLIHWIANKIEKKLANPDEIIAITFTNKAADELRERLNKQIGDKAKSVVCGTFHSLAFTILNKMKPQVSSIFDANSRKNIFAILFPKRSQAEIKAISKAYEMYHEGITAEDSEEYLGYFEAYHSYLDKHNAVDLSAIIWHVNSLLEHSNSVLDSYTFLTVDEFQDINPVQYHFVKLLSKGKTLFAIGDPNQSIYGFRGSDLSLFFKATSDFNATEIALQKNYRTPAKILEATSSLISINEQRAVLVPMATKKSDILLNLYEAQNAKQEAKYIAEKILHYIGGTETTTTGESLSDYNYAFSDIAVLTRTRFTGREIAQTLNHAGIPIVLSDGTSFLQEEPFITINYALQLLENPKNIVALSGLLTSVGNVPETDIPSLERLYIEDKINLEQIPANDLWKEWVALFNNIQLNFRTYSISETLVPIMDFLLPSSTLEEHDIYKRELLLKSAEEWTGSSKDFLQNHLLSPFTDTARYKNTGVRILTFHAAKGLEFPVVFIAGAEEGLTPIFKQDTNIEEERRLFYVAMTRAIDELNISHATKRKIYGKEEDRELSCFVKEIDQEFIAKETFKSKQNKVNIPHQLRLF